MCQTIIHFYGVSGENNGHGLLQSEVFAKDIHGFYQEASGWFPEFYHQTQIDAALLAALGFMQVFI